MSSPITDNFGQSFYLNLSKCIQKILIGIAKKKLFKVENDSARNVLEKYVTLLFSILALLDNSLK